MKNNYSKTSLRRTSYKTDTSLRRTLANSPTELLRNLTLLCDSPIFKFSMGFSKWAGKVFFQNRHVFFQNGQIFFFIMGICFAKWAVFSKWTVTPGYLSSPCLLLFLNYMIIVENGENLAICGPWSSYPV